MDFLESARHRASVVRRRLVCEFGYGTSFQGYDIICISRTDHRRSGFAREYYRSVFSSILIEIQVVRNGEHCVLPFERLLIF